MIVKKILKKNIEHFLINQQNKLLLEDIKDINLKYKLVNTKIVTVFIASKLLVEKLHLNIK